MKDLKAYSTFAEMQDIVNSFGKQSEVAAIIYGKKFRLKEYQVRALQIMCKRAGEKSDADWQEFVDNVIVYNLPAWIYDDDEQSFEFYDPNNEDEEPTDIHKMIFRKDGLFANEFGCGDNGGNCGFYNRTSDMVFEMF